MIDITEAAQGGEESRVVFKLPAQLLGTLIGRLRFAGSEALRCEERAAER